MQGKTVVITGATSGIGAVAADRLAGQGARIVFVARDKARGEATLDQLNAIAPGAGHAVHYADLSKLAEMKRVGAEIAAAEPKIDVLVNNAGAMFGAEPLTVDGFEKTFALNHMSYFVLTNLLLDGLKAAGAARIVSTASDAHEAAKLDLDGLPARNGSGWRAYANSKLCNILFNRELARRLEGTSVTANCVHPAFVASRFGDNVGPFMAFGIKLAKFFAVTPEQGAATIIWLASSPEVAGASGGYYYKCKPAEPTAAAQNDADAKRLWELSAKLSGVGA